MAKLGEDFPHAGLLIEAGYGTEAKVRNASDEDLLAIKFIGPDALKDIRAALAPEENVPEEKVDGDKPDEEVKEEVARLCANPACGHKITESPCPYCGTV